MSYWSVHYLDYFDPKKIAWPSKIAMPFHDFLVQITDAMLYFLKKKLLIILRVRCSTLLTQFHTTPLWRYMIFVFVPFMISFVTYLTSMSVYHLLYYLSYIIIIIIKIIIYTYVTLTVATSLTPSVFGSIRISVLTLFTLLLVVKCDEMKTNELNWMT